MSSILRIEEILADIVRRSVGRVNVSLPGVVLSYDSSTQTATVQPVIRQAYSEEESEEEKVWYERIPPIPKVPVAFWQAGGFAIHAPLAPGDFVTLLVQDRSIDEFMATGNEDVSPRDPRRFNWSDAIALPSPPSPTPIGDLDADNMHVGNEVARLRFTPTGKIAIEAGGHELIALIRDLVSICQSAITGMGVAAFNDPASVLALSLLDAKLSSMEIP